MKPVFSFQLLIRSIILFSFFIFYPQMGFGGMRLPGSDDAEPGVVLVKFRQGLTPNELAAEAQALGLTDAQPATIRQAFRSQHHVRQSQRISPLNVERWSLSPDQSLEKTISSLEQSCLVEYAQPNYQRVALAILPDGPDDPYYQNGSQWWLEAIAADRVFAEGILPSGEEVIIAVIDSGILLNHEDLASRLVAGKDYVNAGGNANDDYWHGTHVAGIAAALTNNAVGIAGTASAAAIKLMPVKVLDEQGDGYDWDIAAGIIWAADQGARILNLSLGGSADSTILENAVEYAYQKGCVVVAAAGNFAEEGNPVLYPAAFDKVIAVAACGPDGVRATYSEYHDYIDIAAPGGVGGASADMLSTYNESSSSYTFAYGTSMAAPVVAGVAAMLLAQDPDRTPDEVENLMTTTAEKTGSLINDADGWNRFLGWGRVNLYNALTKSSTFSVPNETSTTYNYPNPFQPARGEQTYIVIPATATSTEVKLRIFDAVGKPVWTFTLSSSEVWAGRIIAWDGRNKDGDLVANGVYPFVLEMNGKIYKNKIAVLNY